MPFPVLLVVGGVAAAVSLGATGYAVLRKRNARKKHDERYEKVKTVQEEAEAVYDDLVKTGEGLGKVKVRASETLEGAAQYLRAVAKELELEDLPEIPDEILAEWESLRSEIAQSLGLGLGGAAASGATAAAGSTLYTAAGLFGVTSTGVRIGGLSGAAAQSARLAWIGGGALATGGGGVALGSTILNVLSKANIVTVPLSLGLSAWEVKKTLDLEKQVDAKIEEFARAEINLGRKMTVMQGSISRIMEIQEGVENEEQALQNLLRKARGLPAPETIPTPTGEGTPNPDLHLPHQVYLTAKALRELLEQPGLSEDVRRIIEE